MTEAQAEYWDAEARQSAMAYVQCLAAAELAVQRGQFNTAKILRAVAHNQRATALQLTRLLATETTPATLLMNVLERTDRSPMTKEAAATSSVVRVRSAELVARALRSLAMDDEIHERDMPLHLWGCYGCGYLAEGERPDVCPSCGALGVEFEWFGPFYSSSPEHLGQLLPDEILATLERVPQQVAAALVEHDDASLQWRPEPGEWCAKEIVGHMIETDALFARRVQTVLAAQGTPTLDTPVPPWQLHEGKSYDVLPTAELLDRLRFGRGVSCNIVSGLTPEQWGRRGLVRGAGTSVLDLGTWLANHDRGHLAQLGKRLEAAAN